MEIKAVVIHWDGGQPKSIKQLKAWMKKYRPGLNYHRFVKGEQIEAGGKTGTKLYHCGGNLYTAEAIQYFGDYCPDWDHRDRLHNNSPNNCTIGVCMLHDYPDGGYTTDTIYTGAKLAAELLKYYGLGMEGIWTHHMITGKKCPKMFVDEPGQWELFRNIVNDFLEGRA